MCVCVCVWPTGDYILIGLRMAEGEKWCSLVLLLFLSRVPASTDNFINIFSNFEHLTKHLIVQCNFQGKNMS